MAEHRMNALAGWRELDDQDLVELVCEDLDTWLDGGLYDPAAGPSFQEPTPGQVGLYALWRLERSLWFEGVETTLQNSDGVYLPAAMEAYRLFGIPACEQWARRTIESNNLSPYPYDQAERQQRLPDADEFSELYDELYEAFESAMGAAKPHPADYVRAHPDEFFV